MLVLKLFISQPTAGRDPKAIIAERDLVLDHVRSLVNDDVVVREIPPVVSFEDGQVPRKTRNASEAVRLLGRSIVMLSDADRVFFVPGWGDDPQCQIEHEITLKYNLPIVQDTHLWPEACYTTQELEAIEQIIASDENSKWQ